VRQARESYFFPRCLPHCRHRLVCSSSNFCAVCASMRRFFASLRALPKMCASTKTNFSCFSCFLLSRAHFVFLRCLATTNFCTSALLVLVQWGDFVVSDKAQVVSHINLTVESVFDGGLYACTATNSLGSVTHAAHLHVPGRSVIRTMADRTVTAGQSILLPCWVVGDEPEAIHWHKGLLTANKPVTCHTFTAFCSFRCPPIHTHARADGRRVPFNHRQRLHKNGSLEISSLDKLIDTGRYNCSVHGGREPATMVKLAEQSMQLLVKGVRSKY
jgi:hypothetical protein